MGICELDASSGSSVRCSLASSARAFILCAFLCLETDINLTSVGTLNDKFVGCYVTTSIRSIALFLLCKNRSPFPDENNR